MQSLSGAKHRYVLVGVPQTPDGTSANAVDVVRHIYETHGEDTEILFGPDMWLGAYVEQLEEAVFERLMARRDLVYAAAQRDDGEDEREIARGVAFLVGEDAGFVTGSTLSINGGQHMY